MLLCSLCILSWDTFISFCFVFTLQIRLSYSCSQTQERMYLIIPTSLKESNFKFLLKELKLLLEHHKAFSTLPLFIPIFLLAPILHHGQRCATRNLCETTIIMYFFYSSQVTPCCCSPPALLWDRDTI